MRDGRLYGRGSVDMKGGLAAAVIAAERLASDPARLAGDLLVAAVVDEEWVSAGAEALVRRYRADAAILPEQSDLDIVVEHGGFAWFEVHSIGVEAAGIEPDAGVDAIALLTPVLRGLVELDRRLAMGPRPDYGRPSVHPSTISSGTQFPAYAQSCVLGIERCTVAGESVAGARAEIQELLHRAAAADSRFEAELRLIVGREPVQLDADGPLVRALDRAIEARLGRPSRHVGDIGWSDSGILAEAEDPMRDLRARRRRESHGRRVRGAVVASGLRRCPGSERAFASRWPNSSVYFASKAFSCSGVIRVFAEEGLGCDVASAGELAVALAGGMPADRILLHGNAKGDVDLGAALEAGVGLIVVDSLDELDRLERLATRTRRALLRANPDVSATTHEAMATGHAASKFGLPPAQLREASRRIASSALLELDGSMRTSARRSSSSRHSSDVSRRSPGSSTSAS